MYFCVRCMGSVQNLLGFPDCSQMSGRTSRAPQVSLPGHSHTNTSSLSCCAALCRCLPTHSHCVKHSPTLRGYFVSSRGSTYQEKGFFSQELLPCSLVFREMSPEMCFSRHHFILGSVHSKFYFEIVHRSE